MSMKVKKRSINKPMRVKKISMNKQYGLNKYEDMIIEIISWLVPIALVVGIILCSAQEINNRNNQKNTVIETKATVTKTLYNKAHHKKEIIEEFNVFLNLPEGESTIIDNRELFKYCLDKKNKEIKVKLNRIEEGGTKYYLFDKIIE